MQVYFTKPLKRLYQYKHQCGVLRLVYLTFLIDLDLCPTHLSIYL